MAANRPEVDIIEAGMELKDPYNNQTFIQNLYKNRAIWESREGFGTVAEINGQLNALDLKPGRSSETLDLVFGLEKCLGTYAFRTEFGHDQIVSIFYSRNTTTNYYSEASDKVYNYTVVIYDATTNNYWYETLYRHTADQTEVLQVSPYYRGYYETRNYGSEYMSPTLAKPLPFFFKDYLGVLYFGNAQGVWVYNPTAFIDNRYKQVNIVNNRDELNDQQSNHYGETGLITPIIFVDGTFAVDNAYTYIQDGDISNFVDLEAFEGRIIYAAGKTLYFSDVGQANSIIGANAFTFHEMNGNISAIQQINGAICVWSESQTFLYQPSQGILQSGGRPVRVHDEVGCINAQCVLFRENVVYWMDTNGVYVTTNGLELQDIGLPIKRFFQYETINPFIHYFTNNGFAGPSSQQAPDFLMRAEGNFDSVHLDYDQVNEQLFVVFPLLNMAWVFKGGWYLWTFNSIVDSSYDEETESYTYLVNNKTQVSFPIFASTQTKTFIVGGKKETSMYYTTGNGNIGYTEHEVGAYSSFRIFEWKRGGAQDGSTYDYIEGRRFAGFYRRLVRPEEASSMINWYFDPAERYGGYLNVDKDALYEQNDDVWLLPIRLSVETPSQPSWTHIKSYSLSFHIDKTRWLPFGWDGAVDDAMYFILPTERSSGYLGFTPGGPAAPTSECSYDPVEGLITIKWDASVVPANNLSNPNGIYFYGRNKHDMIYIPLRKVNRDSTLLIGQKNPTTNIVTDIVDRTIIVTDGITDTTISDAFAYDWQPGWFQFVTPEERTQGIDWCYKSKQIGIEGESQIKARGSYSLISTTGVGEQITPWFYGIWNSVAGSDYKDYVSQEVDFVGSDIVRQDLVNIANVEPIRTRIKSVPFGMTTKTFDNVFPITYGDAADPNEGNYYVDTQEVDTIVTSDSVRGETVSYTFFGFMQDKANKLLIRNVKVALQEVAGRRRRGR